MGHPESEGKRGHRVPHQKAGHPDFAAESRAPIHRGFETVGHPRDGGTPRIRGERGHPVPQKSGPPDFEYQQPSTNRQQKDTQSPSHLLDIHIPAVRGGFAAGDESGADCRTPTFRQNGGHSCFEIVEQPDSGRNPGHPHAGQLDTQISSGVQNTRIPSADHRRPKLWRQAGGRVAGGRDLIQYKSSPCAAVTKPGRPGGAPCPATDS